MPVAFRSKTDGLMLVGAVSKKVYFFFKSKETLVNDDDAPEFKKHKHLIFKETKMRVQAAPKPLPEVKMTVAEPKKAPPPPPPPVEVKPELPKEEEKVEDAAAELGAVVLSGDLEVKDEKAEEPEEKPAPKSKKKKKKRGGK